MTSAPTSPPPLASAPGSTRAFYWLCQVGGWGLWTAIGLLLVRQQAGQLTADTVTGYGLFFAYAIALSHLLHGIIRRRGWLALTPAQALWRLAAAAAGLGLVLTACVVLVTIVQHGAASAFNDPGNLAALAANLVFASVVWTVLHASLATWLRHRSARQQAEALERSLNAARLKALEAQVSPHFLFNCLNNLRGMIAEDTTRAQDMVTRLANILRHNLTRDGDTTVEPLAEQAAVMMDYLELERVRFDERLRTRVDIEPAAATCRVPAMLLQTLVENAIKHGIAHLPEGGEVAISARREREDLVVAVENTGALAGSPADSTRVGLANLRARLQLLHGPAATCTLRTVASDRVRAEVRLPWPHPHPASPF